MSITEKQFDRLLRLGLVESDFVVQVSDWASKEEGTFWISEKGRDFLIYRKSTLLNKWVPYLITTAIAVIALILSFIALLSQ